MPLVDRSRRSSVLLTQEVEKSSDNDTQSMPSNVQDARNNVEKKPTAADVLRDIKTHGFRQVKPVIETDEIPDERVDPIHESTRVQPLPLATSEFNEYGLPFGLTPNDLDKYPIGSPEYKQIFAKIHAHKEQQASLEQSIATIPQLYKTTATIYEGHALLGRKQQKRYSIFCTVINILYKAYRQGKVGLSRSKIRSKMSQANRPDCEMILQAAIDKDLVASRLVQDRMVYSLTQRCIKLNERVLAQAIAENLSEGK